MTGEAIASGVALGNLRPFADSVCSRDLRRTDGLDLAARGTRRVSMIFSCIPPLLPPVAE